MVFSMVSQSDDQNTFTGNTWIPWCYFNTIHCDWTLNSSYKLPKTHNHHHVYIWSVHLSTDARKTSSWHVPLITEWHQWPDNYYYLIMIVFLTTLQSTDIVKTKGPPAANNVLYQWDGNEQQHSSTFLLLMQKPLATKLKWNFSNKRGKFTLLCAVYRLNPKCLSPYLDMYSTSLW